MHWGCELPRVAGAYGESMGRFMTSSVSTPGSCDTKFMVALLDGHVSAGLDIFTATYLKSIGT